jgi:cbb3-type cytochrome oxidase cytochrome c subunit
VTASLLVIASMGILTYKGATAEEALGSEVLAQADEIAQGQRLPEQARPGLEIFLQVGCLNCHTYAGEGSPNLGAPELTEEGTRQRGTQWQIDHLRNPPGLVPGSPMPAFTEFTDEQYQQLAVFLECSPGNAPACQQALGAAQGGS